MEEKKLEEKRAEEIGDAVALISSRKLSDVRFKQLVTETLEKHPIESGYDSRCYCRRCNASWEMTRRGIKKLKEKSPNGEIKISTGVSEQELEGNMNVYYFIIEPCPFCKAKEEPIIAEARLIRELFSRRNGNGAATMRNGA